MNYLLILGIILITIAVVKLVDWVSEHVKVQRFASREALERSMRRDFMDQSIQSIPDVPKALEEASIKQLKRMLADKRAGKKVKAEDYAIAALKEAKASLEKET